jgi:hypothetical protein
MKDFYITPVNFDEEKQKKILKYSYIAMGSLVVIYIILGILLFIKKSGNGEPIVFEDCMSFGLNILVASSVGLFWSAFFERKPPYLKLENGVFSFRKGFLNKVNEFNLSEINNIELKLTQLYVKTDKKEFKIDCSNYSYSQIQEIKLMLSEMQKGDG